MPRISALVGADSNSRARPGPPGTESTPPLHSPGGLRSWVASGDLRAVPGTLAGFGSPPGSR
jgi:hypothetical protein